MFKEEDRILKPDYLFCKCALYAGIHCVKMTMEALLLKKCDASEECAE